MGKRKAVFLDRDGTINVEVQYLNKVEEFQFIPGVPYALKRLKDAGLLLVVVTNQSGIGRGIYDEAALQRVHDHMQRELAAFGVEIDACYFCPHHPEHAAGEYLQDCSCRKPLPGMLRQAAETLDIDLASSYMVGDKLIDVEVGINAGCTPIMVLTGYGSSHVERLPEGIMSFADLNFAADAILEMERQRAGA